MRNKKQQKTKIYVSTILEELGKDHNKIYFNTLSDIYNKLEINSVITFDEFKEMLNKYLSNSNIDYYYENSIANDGENYINFNNKKEANKFVKLLREKFEKNPNVQ